ncbi:MAG: NAD-dependent epimerase/dehydratase family protein, partial [Streptomyces sp.]|nr:NAD-dependent epimerase/dehydratase family protein [Streptomyces sp.]
VPDMAGPRVEPFADLMRAYLRTTGRRRPFVPLPLPGAGARALRSGANLAPDHAVGTRTWEDFLGGLEDARGTKAAKA